MSSKSARAANRPVGMIPAAGLATRLGKLPCSKEILPIGLWENEDGAAGRTKVACHYLLERMRRAGVERVHIILRDGKWDIPAFLGNGRTLGMRISYHIAEVPHGPAYSLDEAYPFVRDDLVATGFPDLIFQPDNAFTRLVERQAATGADIVLGLFPTDRPEAMDMVHLDPDGRIRGIDIKPAETDLEYTWIIAVWTPAFTEFMHTYLERALETHQMSGGEEVEAHVGTAIRAALGTGLRFESVRFADGSLVDVGSADHLRAGLEEVQS